MVEQELQNVELGPFSVDLGLIEKMVELVPAGILLELGSGAGTDIFSQYYEVHSVEHNELWLNRYNSHYIHAPIVDGWYDTEVLKAELPESYDVMLIDGPTSAIGRYRFLDYADGLFNLDIPLFIDDVNRKPEMELLEKLSKRLGREFTVVAVPKYGREFGFII